MNKRIYALLVALCIALGCLAGCGNDPQPTEPSTGGNQQIQAVDYAGTVKLNMDSATLKQEVTVKAYIDGIKFTSTKETAHIIIPIIDTIRFSFLLYSKNPKISIPIFCFLLTQSCFF